MIMEIISILLGVILLGTMTYGYGDSVFEPYRLRYLINLPSLIIVLVFTVPALFKGGVWKDFMRAWKLLRKDYTCHLSELRRTLDVVEMMQKQLIYAGIISTLLSLVNVFHRLSDPTSWGPIIAMAILTMLYALIFEMLLLPLQLEVKRRIIDYMEIDTDAESERVTVEKACESVTMGEGNEKTVTEKEGETEKKGTEETVAGTEEGQI